MSNPQVELPQHGNIFTQKNYHDSYPAISPTRPELSARGKNVIVTGGGTGIGKAIAIAFAQAGASSITVLGRREDRLKKAVQAISDARSNQDTQVLYRSVDIIKREEAIKAVNSIVGDVGKISVFIANIGALAAVAPVAELDGGALMKGFETNVISTLNSIQAFLPHAAPDAVFINTSTAVVHMDIFPNLTAYSASKAANARLVDQFAAEHPEIRVHNLHPGTVMTELSEAVLTDAEDTAELPAHFSVWLASPEGAFLRGKFVWAHFDVDELKERAEEIRGSNLLTIRLDGLPNV